MIVNNDRFDNLSHVQVGDIIISEKGEKFMICKKDYKYTMFSLDGNGWWGYYETIENLNYYLNEMNEDWIHYSRNKFKITLEESKQ